MRNITYTLVCSNDACDYYVAKQSSGWYTFGVHKGGHPSKLAWDDMIAGFTTKRVAVQCARSWCANGALDE